jgi:hypothetical protein
VTPSEWDEARRTDVVASQAVHKQRLDDMSVDIDNLAAAQRDGLKEYRGLLDGALTAVNDACQNKVDAVAKDIKALRQEVRDDREAREKNKASGKLVVVAIIGASATVLTALIAAAVALVTGGPS